MPGAGKAIERRFAGPDAEPPAALPEAQERALGDFLAAHDEEDARTAEAAPESGEDTPAETSPDADPCPVEVRLHPDRFPCQLARGHGGDHVYGPRESWPAEAAPEPDEHDISDEESEAARADLIARFGAIPPSLQRVIDMGGRFGRAAAGEESGDAPAGEPGSEDEEPEPAVAEVSAPVAEDESEPVTEDDVEPERARPVETISLPEPEGDPVPAAEDSPEPAQDETTD